LANTETQMQHDKDGQQKYSQ